MDFGLCDERCDGDRRVLSGLAAASDRQLHIVLTRGAAGRHTSAPINYTSSQAGGSQLRLFVTYSLQGWPSLSKSNSKGKGKGKGGYRHAATGRG